MNSEFAAIFCHKIRLEYIDINNVYNLNSLQQEKRVPLVVGEKNVRG